MKVFAYHAGGDDYAFVSLSEAEDRVDNTTGQRRITGRFCQGKSLLAGWTPPRLMIERGKRFAVPDFSYVSFGIPVFSEAALALLDHLVGRDVELLPTRCERGTFYLVNVLRILDCLDPSASEFERWNDGFVRKINRHVFREGFRPPCHMFLIKQSPTGATYVSETLKETVEGSALKGGFFLSPDWATENLPAPAPEPDKGPSWTGASNQFGLLTKPRLEQFESLVGQTLPDGFRAYLLAHNGGMPGGVNLWLPGESEPSAEILHAYGLHHGPEAFQLEKQLDWHRQHMMKGLIPFASDGGGNQFCIGTTGKHCGKVFLWDHETEDCPIHWRNFEAVANSFAKFLTFLRPTEVEDKNPKRKQAASRKGSKRR